MTLVCVRCDKVFYGWDAQGNTQRHRRKKTGTIGLVSLVGCRGGVVVADYTEIIKKKLRWRLLLCGRGGNAFLVEEEKKENQKKEGRRMHYL